MKKSRLLIFLTLVFSLYALINVYIHSNATKALTIFGPDWSIIVFNVAFIFIVFSYPVARIFGKWFPIILADFLSLIGGMWFAAILYLILAIVSIDLIRLIIDFVPAINQIISENNVKINGLAFGSIIFAVISLLTYGYFNAISPRIKTLNIPIAKSANGPEQLHVVFASDIHLGHVIGKRSLSGILKKIDNLTWTSQNQTR